MNGFTANQRIHLMYVRHSVPWVPAAAHECQQIASEEHLNNANASTEHSSECLSERLHIVDPEPIVSSTSEAA